jgi:predicted lipoprotein with Yx(FWY)xxD motif
MAMKLFGNPRRSAFAVLAVAAIVALAACGSSSKTTVSAAGAQPLAASSSTTAKPVAPPSTAAAAAKPVVMVAMTAKFGSILVDAKGMTLYTLTNAGAAVACTGQCATFWPPLLLPSSAASAVGAKGVSGLGNTSGETGSQVTENGLPLYRFSMDKAPGDTNGDGISSFGGVWHVVSSVAGASTVTTGPPMISPPMTSPPATLAPANVPAVPAPTNAPAPTSGNGY